MLNIMKKLFCTIFVFGLYYFKSVSGIYYDNLWLKLQKFIKAISDIIYYQSSILFIVLYN